MDFSIDLPPPVEDEIIKERELTSERLKSVRTKDMIVTSLIVLVTSTLVALVVYWLTNSIKYAAISASIYPILSVVLNKLGITANTGFRSAAVQIVELNNKLIGLKTVADDNPDIEELSGKYKEIKHYVEQVRAMGRSFVNRELMMFWEWDTSTQAKTAQVRSYLKRAKKSISGDEQTTQDSKAGEVKDKDDKAEEEGGENIKIEGFELDMEEKPEG